MNKKKIMIGTLIGSGALFVFLLISQIVKITQIFKNPSDFSLYPLMFVIIYLLVLLGHLGLYVMIMDHEDRKFLVEDDDRWWEKWDQA